LLLLIVEIKKYAISVSSNSVPNFVKTVSLVETLKWGHTQHIQTAC